MELVAGCGPQFAGVSDASEGAVGLRLLEPGLCPARERHVRGPGCAGLATRAVRGASRETRRAHLTRSLPAGGEGTPRERKVGGGEPKLTEQRGASG